LCPRPHAALNAHHTRSSDVADKTAALEDTQTALFAAQGRADELDCQLQEALASLASLKEEHAALAAKLARREEDFDLLLAEQRDTAARLAEAEAALEEAGQRADESKEALDAMADQVLGEGLGQESEGPRRCPQGRLGKLACLGAARNRGQLAA
jgi:chromosome segregation ATPase